MQTDENNKELENDEGIQRPGDDLATKDEIQEAIRSLYLNQSAKKRLVAVAALILKGKPNLKRQYLPEDLFQEALERIAIGVRTWPKNRVDFTGLVIGVMKSWSYSLEKTKSKENLKILMEHELAFAEGSDEPPNLEEMASDSSTPLERIEADELDAIEQNQLALLKAQYEPHELPALILEIIIGGPFENHEEIRSVLGVKEADYRNAWKVLMRAAKKLETKE